MKVPFTHKHIQRWLVAASVCVLVVGLAACAPQQNTGGGGKGSGPMSDVKAPAPNDNGIITADSWKDVYPQEYAGYEKNGEDFNAQKEYSDDYPEIKTLWAGSSFATSYRHPDGHDLSLETIKETPRAPKTANCLTCKSSEYILKQNADPTLNKSDIKAMENEVSEPISCYDCHENDPSSGSRAIRKFFVDAVGSDASKLPESAMACGQCHNEYMMPGDNKATANAFTSLATATPEKELAAENALGYVDHTNPTNGTKQLKVQHPEFETMYGGEGSPMAKQGYGCADCHMPKTKADDGTEYSDHNWQSPLNNDQLIADNCSKCHKDIKSEVAAAKKTTIDRIHSVGAKIVSLDNKLSDIVTAGSMSEDQLNQIRDLNRTAQWYWDYVFVENSKGAHNPQLAKDTLDKSETAAEQALAMM